MFDPTINPFDPKLNPNEDGLIYDEWINLVDMELLRICGVQSADLADFPSYDLWNDSISPYEAAECCLVEWNDYPESLFEELI